MCLCVQGVMLSHTNLVNLIDWSVREYDLSNSTTVLLKTAVSFDPSVFEIFAPLALGGRLVIAKPGGHEDPAYVRDLVTSQRYDLYFALLVVFCYRSFTHLITCCDMRILVSRNSLPARSNRGLHVKPS